MGDETVSIEVPTKCADGVRRWLAERMTADAVGGRERRTGTRVVHGGPDTSLVERTGPAARERRVAE